MGLIQITAYVRDEEDLNKWKALENKTQFIHDALQGNTVHIAEEKPFKGPKIVNSPEDVKKIFPEAKVVKKPEPVTTTAPIHAA